MLVRASKLKVIKTLNGKSASLQKKHCIKFHWAQLNPGTNNFILWKYCFFKAVLKPLTGSGRNTCGGYVTATTSPRYISPQTDYSGQYYNSEHCTWQITAATGMVLKLTLSSVDIEYQSTCSYDSLDVSVSSLVIIKWVTFSNITEDYHNILSERSIMKFSLS